MHIFSKIWNFQTTKLVTLRATLKESKNFQGYYNTGWFNPKMRSRAAF